MADKTLDSALQGLQLTGEDLVFHPRKGFEDRRGSEQYHFYVITAGRMPGIYTHWEDATRQVSGFSNAVYKKHLGWSAATSAWDQARRPASPPLTTPIRPTTPVKTERRVAVPPLTPAPAKKRGEMPPAPISAPSTPTGSRGKRLLYVYSGGDDTTIYADEQRASSAVRRGLADSSFHKMEVTPHICDVFAHSAESALEVYNVSDFSDTD
ncbi:hypothetical protein K438DRAFT_1961157 [Mycena galopus ATCC 62051]|nr:hypothetical protein K438DRAFT_1961157 [Mycena galopus ATCC 62051]